VAKRIVVKWIEVVLVGFSLTVIRSIAEGTDDDGLLQRSIAIILRDSEAGKDCPKSGGIFNL
jgi:hypothetical protein